MAKPPAIPDAFKSLQAWMHQDADAAVDFSNWAKSLDPRQRRELRSFIESMDHQPNTLPSFSRLMKTYAPDWNIAERRLRTIFHDQVMKELN